MEGKLHSQEKLSTWTAEEGAAANAPAQAQGATHDASGLVPSQDAYVCELLLQMQAVQLRCQAMTAEHCWARRRAVTLTSLASWAALLILLRIVLLQMLTGSPAHQLPAAQRLAQYSCQHLHLEIVLGGVSYWTQFQAALN